MRFDKLNILQMSSKELSRTALLARVELPANWLLLGFELVFLSCKIARRRRMRGTKQVL